MDEMAVTRPLRLSISGSFGGSSSSSSSTLLSKFASIDFFSELCSTAAYVSDFPTSRESLPH